MLHRDLSTYIAKASTYLVSANSAIVDPKLKHPECVAALLNASLSVILLCVKGYYCDT